MRLRALLATTGLAATAAMTALPTPAFAGGSGIVRSLSGFETTVDSCDAASTGSLKIVNDASRAGSGSVRMAVGSNVASYVELTKLVAPVPFTSAFVLDFDAITDTSIAAHVVTDLFVDADGSSSTTADIVDFYNTATTTSSWTTVHAAAGLKDFETDSPIDPSFFTNNPNAKFLGYTISVGCLDQAFGDPMTTVANEAMRLDNVIYGTVGTDAVTADFEPASTFSYVSGGGTLTAGAAGTLSAVLKSGTTVLTSKPVEVWAKPYGASSYTKVATVTTDGYGLARYAIRPTVQTAYYFKYAGAEPSYGSAQSAVQTVYVRTKITKNVYDTTVTTTQPVLVYGLTVPAKPGTIVTLYRGTAGIGSARVASDGTYLIQARITVKGKFALVVKGAAGTGNLAGTSSASYVTVS